MSKSTKPPKKASQPEEKPIALAKNNVPNKISDNPRRQKQQEYYYANQQRLLDQKAEYRKRVKEGTHVPVKKNSPDAVTKSPWAKNVKYTTDEEKHEAKLRDNNKWYQNNKDKIAEAWALKKEKEKEEKKRQILENWEKFKQENE